MDELYFPEDKIDWPVPWWCLDKDLELRTGIQKELNLEIGPKHPLWGLKPVVIGKSDANDDVILYLSDGRFACVHLVWHEKIDQYPDKFPSFVVFENVASLQTYINDEADEYI